MDTIRLYGKGAVSLHDQGGKVYMPHNGVLEIPVHMLAQANAHGYSSTVAPEEVILEDDIPQRRTAEEFADMQSITPSVDDAIARFNVAVQAANVEEFQSLLADGWAEHEARELVWPSAGSPLAEV